MVIYFYKIQTCQKKTIQCNVFSSTVCIVSCKLWSLCISVVWTVKRMMLVEALMLSFLIMKLCSRLDFLIWTLTPLVNEIKNAFITNSLPVKITHI